MVAPVAWGRSNAEGAPICTVICADSVGTMSRGAIVATCLLRRQCDSVTDPTQTQICSPYVKAEYSFYKIIIFHYYTYCT